MQRIPYVFVLLGSLVLGLMSPSPAGAQVQAPLAERVPSDALLYVGWCGAERARQLATETHTEALLQASQATELFEQTLPRLGKALAARNPDARAWVKFFAEIAPILYRHPTAVAFGGVDYSNPEQALPRILIVCDAGDEAPMLRMRFTELFRMVGRIELVTLMDVQDGVLYLNLGWQRLELAMAEDDAGHSLAGSERFQAALKGLIQDPLKAGFIDLPGIAAMLEEGARRDGGEKAASDFRQFLDATGLRGLGAVAFTTGFQERLYRTAAFVELRGVRTGLLELLDGGSFDESLLAHIPADAGFVAAGRADLSKLLTAARNAVIVFSPDNAGSFEQGLKFINLLVGADIERDVLGALGHTWAAYSAPATGDSALGVVAINRPTRPQRLEPALRNLSLSTVSLINQTQRQQEKPARITGRSVSSAHGEIHYLDLPLVAPSWLVDGRLAWFSLHPQSLLSARSAGVGQGHFGDSEALAGIRALAGENQIRGFTWIDLPRYGPRAYWPMNAAVQLGAGTLSTYGETSGITARLPSMLLPPYATFQEHLAPAVSVTWVDSRGLHLRSTEPFPLSGLLLIGMR